MKTRKELQQSAILALVIVVLAGCTGPLFAPATTPTPIPTPTPVPISHVYAFGDSFSDNGNMKRLAPLLYPWDVWWQGRISNGPVAVEVLARRLNVELTDYAVAGARSDTGNIDERFPNTGTLAQAKEFEDELGGYSADPDALYFVMVGTNDCTQLLMAESSASTYLSPDPIVDNIATLIGELAEVGAKRFLVINSSSFATEPYIVASGWSQRAAELETLMVAELSSRVVELGEQLGVEITLFDLITLSTKIHEHPSDYGLTNVTDPCQPVWFGMGSECESPDEYYFWDELHPTRRVHEVLGEAMAALYGR